MKIKYFVSALLVSLCLVFIQPFESNAALAVGDTFVFNTNDLYVNDSQTNWSQTQRIDLGENLTGYYRFVFQFSEDIEFTGDTGVSYLSDYSIIVNGVEYFPVKDSGTNQINFTVPLSNQRYIGLKWNLTYWVNTNNSNVSICSFKNTATLSLFTLGLTSQVIYHSYDNTVNENITSQFGSLNNNLTQWFNDLFDKIDNDQEELLNGYDPAIGDQANTDFSNSTADLEAAEGSLFENTSYNQVDYNQFDSFFSLESVGGAILFVKSALEAMYSSLGIFGIPISIGLVLLVFTRLIGFQNFTSGGG